MEINLTAQHLFFYKEGKLVVESDFVSGNESRGWSTPAGAYPLTYKQRNATLKGQNYATPVSYWMPFNGGIGMHDAYWRSSFGGKIYKTNGSHGCINLPPAVAKTVYENISAGMPVLCYHLQGSESGTTSTTAQNGGASAAETKPQPTQQAQTNTESGQGSTHETASSHPGSTSKPSAAAQPSAATQPHTAAQSTTAAAQPTTAASQPATAASSGNGSAQAYPGQNSSTPPSSSGSASSGGPGSGSGGTQSTPGGPGNTQGSPSSSGVSSAPGSSQMPGPGAS